VLLQEPDHVRVLGIETSCDETAAAVVEDGSHVLSDVVQSQIEIHRPYGGPVPEIASRSHLEVILPVIETALERADLTLGEIDAIAVTNRPGLIGALLVGVAAAKALALATGKPIIGVDHVAAHIYASWMDRGSPPPTPFISLVVSGGHTSIFRLDDPFEPREIGSTGDDAAGEAFDKVAAVLKLGYPGGPIIDREAKEGDPKRFPFKPPLMARNSLDFSFSGIKTAVLYTVRGTGRRDPVPLEPQNVKDLAASFQEASVEALVGATFRAVLQSNAQAVLVGGGCAANSRLRERFTEEADRHGVELQLPTLARCTDNAVMIAGLGYHELVRNGADDLTLDARPTR